MFNLQSQNPLAQLEHSQKQWDELQVALRKRAEKRGAMVRSREVAGLGVVEEMDRDGAFWEADAQGGKVVKLITRYGGHDRVGLQEGLQDIMADVFGLRS
jgi:abhydrolase domain-containing protein 12